MASAVEVIFITIVTAVQVIGLFLNSCIVSLNFKSLKNEPITNASTLIYFAMGLVNMFVQLNFMIQNVLSTFWPHCFYVRELTLSFITLNLAFMHYSFWLTGWLCAYYCVTIGNTSHRLIIMLKRVLSSFLPHTLLLTAIGSIFISVPCIWMFNMVPQMQPQSNGTLEASVSKVILLINPTYTAIAALLSSFLPFTLAVISTGVTTFSLMRHIKHLKRNVSGYSRPNVRTLVNATRTMILFLTCSIIFCGFELVFFVTERKTSFDVKIMIEWFVITSFPSGEAIIIIQAIPKLRKAILEKLCFGQESNNEMCNNT